MYGGAGQELQGQIIDPNNGKIKRERVVNRALFPRQSTEE
jgi:hypothetical protein